MHLQSNLVRPGVALAALLSLATACGDDEDAGPSGKGGTAGSSAKGGTGGKGGTATGGTTTGGKGGTASGGTTTGGTGGSTTGGGGSGGQGGASGSGGTSGSTSGGEAGEQGASRVSLGSAENFVILAKAAVSTVPPSDVTGDIGVSPAAATYITGFSLTADSSDTFSTSPQVTGSVYAADYTSPTPSELTTAVSDMELAFTEAAGRAPDVTELGAGDIGGMTLEPGVYQWGTGLLIPTNITLEGNATGVWIFQIAQGLTVSSAVNVVLDGGALAKNVFWQVSGAVELGTTAHFEGIVLGQTAITLGTGASLNGRLFAQTAVSLDANTVVQPAP